MRRRRSRGASGLLVSALALLAVLVALVAGAPSGFGTSTTKSCEWWRNFPRRTFTSAGARRCTSPDSATGSQKVCRARPASKRSMTCGDRWRIGLNGTAFQGTEYFRVARGTVVGVGAELITRSVKAGDAAIGAVAMHALMLVPSSSQQ